MFCSFVCWFIVREFVLYFLVYFVCVFFFFVMCGFNGFCCLELMVLVFFSLLFGVVEIGVIIRGVIYESGKYLLSCFVSWIMVLLFLVRLWF